MIKSDGLLEKKKVSNLLSRTCLILCNSQPIDFWAYNGLIGRYQLVCSHSRPYVGFRNLFSPHTKTYISHVRGCCFASKRVVSYRFPLALLVLVSGWTKKRDFNLSSYCNSALGELLSVFLLKLQLTFHY